MTGLYWEDDGRSEGLLTRRSSKSCLTEREIEEFLFDRLSGVTRESVEEHLLACHECLDRVTEEEDYVRAMRAAASELETESLHKAYGLSEAPEKEPQRRFAWLTDWVKPGTTLALAGAVALAVLAMVHFRPPGPLTETEIALSLERGAEAALPAAVAGQPLRLRLDTSGLTSPAARTCVVVDAVGKVVFSGTAAPAGSNLVVPLRNGLTPGQYWVRLIDSGRNGALLREYSLRVR